MKHPKSNRAAKRAHRRALLLEVRNTLHGVTTDGQPAAEQTSAPEAEVSEQPVRGLAEEAADGRDDSPAVHPEQEAPKVKPAKRSRSTTKRKSTKRATK